MSFRNAYGNDWSENGWRMVDQGSCQWVTVPGTSVTLQIQVGQPLALLRAWAADWNAFIEPLRDADSACWTATNSVGTSNHLSGTAVDLNWNSHPFQKRGSLNSAQMSVLEEMEDFYEGTVFWAGRWDSPVDEMHSQVGYNTYGNPHTQDFINRKIRPDGFSTFRRGAAPAPSPVTPAVMTVPLVQNADGTWTSPSPAWAHLIRRESSGNPTIIQQITDVNSGGNEAEGLFQITPRTWRAHNGTEFAPSARFATPQEQAIVAARIFTRNPSGSDWGAGLPGREDPKQLAAGLVPTTASQDQGEDDFLSALNNDEQRLLFERTSQVWGALFNDIPSLSKYKAEGEGAVLKTKDLIRSIDAMSHEALVERNALLGNPEAIALVKREADKGDEWAKVVYARASQPEVRSINVNGPF